jgi:hypothetical protein
MMLLHFTLFIKDVQRKQIAGYIDQYAAVKSAWDDLEAFGAGEATGCAYYDDSAVPLRMYLNTGDISSGELGYEWRIDRGVC